MRVLTDLAIQPSTVDDNRDRAIEALGAIDSPALAASRLLNLLDKLPAHVQAQVTVIGMLGKLATNSDRVVPKLHEIVRDEQATPAVRGAAVDALGAYGLMAGEAISPTLQALLRGQENDLRTRAAGALGKIGPGRPEIVTSLRETLVRCDDTAARASQVLGEMGFAAQEAVPDLIDALRCSGPKAQQVQRAAAEALSWTAPVTSTVVDALIGQLASTDDTLVAASAAAALGRIGPGVVPVLVTVLTTAETDVIRRRAANALIAVGAAAAPALVQLLEREDVVSQTHTFARYALARIGPPALPFLIQGLRRGELPARQRILETLYDIGPRAFEGFQWAFEDPGLHVDLAQLEKIYGTYKADIVGSTIVARNGFAVPEALPYLIASLQPITATASPITSTIELRREAARAIAFVGPDAAQAVPLLALALADSDTTLQCEATLALLMIGPRGVGAAPAAAAALANAREDTQCAVDGETEHDVIWMLALRQPAGYQLLQAELLGNSNKVQLSRLLINVLADLGPKAEMAVPALVRNLKTPMLRRHAAEALAAIGAAAHPALLELLRAPAQTDATPGLVEALAGMNLDVRRSAAYALLQSAAPFDPATAEAVATLAQNQGEDRFVPAMLAAALAAHGHPLPEFWAGTGLVAPSSVICPQWPTMKNNASVELTGFDIYRDFCWYDSAASAPTWSEIYNSLLSYWH